MVDSGLVDYVRENLARGYTAEELKAAMINQGYTQKDIDEVFRAVSSSDTAPAPARQGRSRKWIILPVIIITAVIVYLFLQLSGFV